MGLDTRYSETCLNQTLNEENPCYFTLYKLNEENPCYFTLYKLNEENACYFTLYKPKNTCLFQTHKKVLRRFGLDRCHCITTLERFLC